MKKDRKIIEYPGFLIAEGLVWVIRLYQAILSPVFGGQCRFVPTCSDYAIESIRLFGPIRGLFLSLKRLLRCHPFGGSGYDPPNQLWLKKS